MNLEKILRIEAINGFGAEIYSLVARRNPCMIDFRKEVAEEIISEVSSGRILDVGTGPGLLPVEIAMKSGGAQIFGIDLSPRMVQIAKKNAQEHGVSERVNFRIANAASLPFENDYFDFVISTLSFHHWSKPEECLKEIHRVLKKGGMAFIYDLRQDTTKEVDEQVRKKYGLALSFFFLVIVRSHSSISLKEANEILDSYRVDFSEKQVSGKGVILKIQLIK